MDKTDLQLVGAAVIFAALLALVAISTKDKIYDIPGEEVITIVAPSIPEPYIIDSYESTITATQSWDYLEADTTPLLEIEPVEDVVYDYILDEQLTELPPLQG